MKPLLILTLILFVISGCEDKNKEIATKIESKLGILYDRSFEISVSEDTLILVTNLTTPESDYYPLSRVFTDLVVFDIYNEIIESQCRSLKFIGLTNATDSLKYKVPKSFEIVFTTKNIHNTYLFHNRCPLVRNVEKHIYSNFDLNWIMFANTFISMLYNNDIKEARKELSLSPDNKVEIIYVCLGYAQNCCENNKTANKRLLEYWDKIYKENQLKPTNIWHDFNNNIQPVLELCREERKRIDSQKQELK